MRIDDDLAHPLITSHPVRKQSEHELLSNLLAQNTVLVNYFDERCRPTLSMQCGIEKETAQKTLECVKSMEPLSFGEAVSAFTASHDIFEKNLVLNGDNNHPNILLNEYVALNTISLQALDIHEFGTGRFVINDLDEGDGLEQSIHAPLETVFAENVFRSPMVRKGKANRELIDHLAFDDKRICLFEAKALSILRSNSAHITAKRIRSINKDIKKGLRQLNGALRQLKNNAKIFDANDNTIHVNDIVKADGTVIHLIVLISDIYPFLDRKQIATELVQNSVVENNIYFHILDLEELCQLAINTRAPDIFSANLMLRWMATWKYNDIMVRQNRPPHNMSYEEILRSHGLDNEV